MEQKKIIFDHIIDVRDEPAPPNPAVQFPKVHQLKAFQRG